MIKRAPLKTDPPGKCSRWHVIVYNKETKKYDWHTIRGTRDDASEGRVHLRIRFGVRGRQHHAALPEAATSGG